MPTTRLELLVMRIGHAALSYINGRRVDKYKLLGEECVDFKLQSLENPDLPSLEAFIADAIKDACWNGKSEIDWRDHKPSADASERRDHLEYIFKVYSKAYTAIHASPPIGKPEWESLIAILAEFAENCSELMHAKKDVTIDDQTFVLTSFKYRTTMSSLVGVGTSKLGNLGNTVSDSLFQGILEPENFLVQITKMVSEYQIQQVFSCLPQIQSTSTELLALRETTAQLTALLSTAIDRLDSQDKTINSLREAAHYRGAALKRFGLNQASPHGTSPGRSPQSESDNASDLRPSV
mgnify:CR=1 FL=1